MDKAVLRVYEYGYESRYNIVKRDGVWERKRVHLARALAITEKGKAYLQKLREERS